jgi:hypothetical protein
VLRTVSTNSRTGAGLDEFEIQLVPVLLGGGVRLFEGLGAGSIEFERTRTIATGQKGSPLTDSNR